MLNFLLDITPDKSQLLITIKLAGILREKKQEPVGGINLVHT